jgi:hypothetical protein
VAAERPERNEPVNILAEKEKKMMATFLHQMNGLLVGDVSSVVKAEWWVGWPVAPPWAGNGMSSFHACHRSTRKNVLNLVRNFCLPPTTAEGRNGVP